MTGQVSQELVEKVGAAVGRVALIQQAFAQRLDDETPQAARETLANQAQQAAIEAIDGEGLTVEEYNDVVTAAEGDPALEERLLDAARSVL